MEEWRYDIVAGKMLYRLSRCFCCRWLCRGRLAYYELEEEEFDPPTIAARLDDIGSFSKGGSGLDRGASSGGLEAGGDVEVREVAAVAAASRIAAAAYEREQEGQSRSATGGPRDSAKQREQTRSVLAYLKGDSSVVVDKRRIGQHSIKLDRDRFASESELREMCSGINRNPNINQVEFSSNALKSKGATVMADCFEWSSNIQRLAIVDNDIGDEGAIALAKLFASNSNRLESLSLAGNEISDAGLIVLGAAAARSSTLRTLDVSLNPQISSEGVCRLVEEIERRETSKIVNFNFSNNSISHEGVRYLCRLLTSPRNCVASIDLAYNMVEDAGVDLLVAAINSRAGSDPDHVLRRLNLSGNLLTRRGVDRMKASLTSLCTAVVEDIPGLGR
eukprot:GHVU01171510.1.p1 GENE.GHVU01171510.1~~GHVU01171510.1.p1  ORF type:complete len:391 (-),score=61.15 GHVU01171510.1:114-1286(-)